MRASMNIHGVRAIDVTHHETPEHKWTTLSIIGDGEAVELTVHPAVPGTRIVPSVVDE